MTWYEHCYLYMVYLDNDFFVSLYKCIRKMMQSILQTTIKSHITSSTKYPIVQIPSRDRTIVGSGQRAFAQPSLQQLTRQVTSLPNEFGNNTSQIFRGSMFTRVVPTRKCASCG